MVTGSISSTAPVGRESSLEEIKVSFANRTLGREREDLELGSVDVIDAASQLHSLPKLRMFHVRLRGFNSQSTEMAAQWAEHLVPFLPSDKRKVTCVN